MAARFGRVITAMVTPFDEAGRLDLDAAASLARWLVDQGNEGLVVTGTTGEAPTLTDDEKVSLWRAVREVVDVPVLAGTGSNDTAHTVHLTKEAEACGVDGALVVTPYYNRPSQAGIEAHFRTVAESTSLPLVLYDIPVRTGRKIDTGVLVKLASELPNVVAVKDAAGDPAETARLVASVGDRLDVYSGDDSLTLPLLSVGAVGVIGVATHWAAPEHRAMVDAFVRGDVDRARRENQVLIESYDFETGPEAPNPIPTKAMMRVMGHRVGRCRPPMGPEPEWLEDRARHVLSNLVKRREEQVS
ncbi:MAG: 4-hydroxy-tetrahydrodipicolinate synthase [Acidimicrobiales bacterium]|nr:MAG: 4-hydroxy-tetrahydrodipicolinate synthase [Acidimicrobiales bacterium]